MEMKWSMWSLFAFVVMASEDTENEAQSLWGVIDRKKVMSIFQKKKISVDDFENQHF